ncbi:ATP-NAD kinase family protein [Permianibacter aggregans]|uniref:Putative polyphosphate/ATP-dependent NAD kinase n=1 Tax=Permianibacter aggregans TaxID=1510150 RepID=A0A4R6USQ4_9GAMM|nr:ATP-NAD kinase family protein [Permianibacter aggregans]QGX38547.1 ATP-NAD kinase [Permianibacter aggregans]TDQ50328.1 putative polyphosphate/ATP-dependent NAD kinase [Permianibacter aggregans]
MLNLGLVINPWAGIGGAVALKGSDGAEIRAEALRRGAEPKANARVRATLELLKPYTEQLHFFTAGGQMGEVLLHSLGFRHTVIYQTETDETQASDTQAAVSALMQHRLGLILFAGGDGTARDVYTVCGEEQPVLGIPAGVKIHSAVYAVSPKAAGEILVELCTGKALELASAAVKDLDEDQYRAGNVKARMFGYMKVPASPLMQQSKESARAAEPQQVQDIVEYLQENLEDDTLYLIGSGSTCMALKTELGIDASLLGVDAWHNGQQLLKDATAEQLLTLARQHASVKLIITVIGGQGHVFGRGNQQLSPALLRHIGRDHLIVIASPGKLQSLQGRPLLLDTGDAELDQELAGPIRVITGYESEALYALS